MSRKTIPLVTDAPKQNPIDPVSESANAEEQTNKPPSPMRIKVNGPITIEHREKPASSDHPYREWTKVVIEILTLAAVVFYGVVAYRQWKAMLGSNSVNKEALVSVQRAFVYSKELQLYNGIMAVPIENSGSTPAQALIVKTNRHMWKMDDKWPENYDFPDSVPGTPEPRVLGPRETQSAPLIPIGPVCTRLLLTHQLKMLVWGNLSYSDVFGNAHETDFCWQYLGKTTDAEGHSIDISYPCPWHNCTDQDCSKQEQSKTSRSEWQSEQICGDVASSVMPPTSAPSP